MTEPDSSTAPLAGDPYFARCSDADLLAAGAAGDEAAWHELMQRFGDLVYATARRNGLSDADCEDVFQSVFITLLERAETIHDPAALPKWLITTTQRLAWRTHRQRPATAPEDGLEPSNDLTMPRTDELLVEWEQRQLLRQALDQLGSRCRALLTALYVDGRGGYRDIARELGLPMGSIGPTRARCLTRLLEMARSLGMDLGGDRGEG